MPGDIPCTCENCLNNYKYLLTKTDIDIVINGISAFNLRNGGMFDCDSFSMVKYLVTLVKSIKVNIWVSDSFRNMGTLSCSPERQEMFRILVFTI